MFLRVWLAAAIVWIGGLAFAEGPPVSPADPSESGVKYRLAYRFTVGQIVAYDVQQDTEFVSQANETKETSRNTSEFKRHFRVVSVDAADGSCELETTIDRVHMTVIFNNNPGTEIVFKSDDPEFHPAKFKHILASVGKPQAIVKVSAAGQTLKVTPVPGANVAAANALANPQIATPEGYLAPLPETPVAVGGFWKERFSVPVLQDKLPIKIEMLRTYKLAGVKNGKASIEFRTAVLTPVKDAAIEVQLIQRETSGTIVFDLNEGVVISRDVHVDRTVVGPFDGKGSMQAVSTYKERRADSDAVADKPSESTIK